VAWALREANCCCRGTWHVEHVAEAAALRPHLGSARFALSRMLSVQPYLYIHINKAPLASSTFPAHLLVHPADCSPRVWSLNAQPVTTARVLLLARDLEPHCAVTLRVCLCSKNQRITRSPGKSLGDYRLTRHLRVVCPSSFSQPTVTHPDDQAL